MTRAMNTLILTRAHYRRRYGNDAPEQTIPSRFLEEVPSALIENLGGRSPAWSTPAYGQRHGGRQRDSEFGERHYNYEDESQEIPRAFTSSSGPQQKGKVADAPERSIDNIARFFGGKGGGFKPGTLARPAIDLPEPTGHTHLKKGQRVRHSKYGEGTVLVREGSGDDTKLTVMFARHGIKKLMEKFANLEKI
jgi:DNA helicase-2/ATP-dependent DNA helicase PcrA